MTKTIRNLILTGGVAHDYEVTSKMLSDILKKGNVQSKITDDFNILKSPKLQRFDVLTLNCVRWSCKQTPQWKDWAFVVSSDQKEGIMRFLKARKGIMALHAAIINFDTWSEFRKVLGGYWKWSESSHGPYQRGYKMYIMDHDHPITHGIQDFEIHDELYHTLHITKPIHLLVATLWEEKLQPIAWITQYNSARIYYNALGDGVESFQCKEFQQLLIQGALWVSNACTHQTKLR